MYEKRRLFPVRQTRSRDAVDPFPAQFPHCDAKNDTAFVECGFQAVGFVAVSCGKCGFVKTVAFGKMEMGVDDFHF